MKWRSLLLVSFAITALFFSSFSTPQHAFAQSAATSRGQLTTIGTNAFDRIIASVNAFPDPTLTSYFNIGTYLYSQYTKPDREKAVRNVLPIVSAAKNVFTESFNNRVANLPPASADNLSAISAQYTMAMQDAIKYITDEQNKLPSGNNGPNEQALFDGAKKVITDAGNNDTLGSNGLPANASIAAKAAQVEKENLERCSFSFLNTKPFSLIACTDVFVTWIIKNTFLEFAGFLLWATANLLDYVINVAISGFSDWAPAGLYVLWQTIRQIVTMFVVFSGLYLGFMYIINRGQDFQRYIPWIVIFGLFVNFSYPITKAAIDVSNIVSLNIYASALGTTATLAKTNTSGNSAGAQIMKSLGLQGLVMGATAVDGTKTNSDLKAQINTTPAALLVVAYVLYASYIFFIASAILMMRTVALSFIIVASPILFVDAVIPKLGEQAQKLRKIFFEQLSVSIVFMIMLYLSIAMTKVFNNFGGAGSVTGSGVSQIFNVIMMLVMLHIMMKVTKAVSGSIGQMAGDAMGKFGGFAGGAALGLATGGAGLLARSTVGAAAARWSTSETLGNAQGAGGLKGWGARRAMDLSTSLSKSSFDARNTTVMKVAGNMGGLSRGLGMTGTLKTYEQAKIAKDEDIQRRAGMMTNDTAREKYLSGRQNSLGSRMQKATLTAVGFKGDDAKTDADISVEKATEIKEREARKNLFAYSKGTKEEKLDLLKKAGEKQKTLYTTIEKYQSIEGETEEDVKKKIAILESFNDNELAKTLMSNDTLGTNNKKENEDRVLALQKAYAESLRQKQSPYGVEMETADKTKLRMETGEQASVRTAIADNSVNYIPTTPEKVIQENNITLENDSQAGARLDKQTKEALVKEVQTNQDLNEMFKEFMKKNKEPASNDTAYKQTA